jgi:8-oxo-dGTP diphosphatase
MSQTQFTIRCRAIIIKDNKLLVVKHHKDADFYALPGGRMEEAENPLECIQREIKEELGVEIVDPELKYIYQWKNEEKENLEFLFLIRTSEDFTDFENKVRTHGFEIVHMKWIGSSDTTNMYPKNIMNEFRENGFEFEGIKYI